MVKFQPLIFKRKYKNFLPRSKNVKAESFSNAVRVPLLLSSTSRTKNLVLETKNLNPLLFVGRTKIFLFMPLTHIETGFQFLYNLYTTTFGFKFEAEKYLNSQLLYGFMGKNSMPFSPNTSYFLENKDRNFNLLFFGNLSLRLSFYLNQLDANKSLNLLGPKALIGLSNSLKIKAFLPRSSTAFLSAGWNLKYLLQLMQTVGSLGGSKEFFSYSLLKNWGSVKTAGQKNIKLNGSQLLYHTRRVKDKLELLDDTQDKNLLLEYLEITAQISRFKAGDSRLFSLKNILRKTKHRRRSRWNIFSRKYVKIKRYSTIFNENEGSNLSLKFNKTFSNNNEKS